MVSKLWYTYLTALVYTEVNNVYAQIVHTNNFMSLVEYF